MKNIGLREFTFQLIPRGGLWYWKSVLLRIHEMQIKALCTLFLLQLGIANNSFFEKATSLIYEQFWWLQNAISVNNEIISNFKRKILIEEIFLTLFHLQWWQLIRIDDKNLKEL